MRRKTPANQNKLHSGKLGMVVNFVLMRNALFLKNKHCHRFRLSMKQRKGVPKNIAIKVLQQGTRGAILTINNEIRRVTYHDYLKDAPSDVNVTDVLASCHELSQLLLNRSLMQLIGNVVFPLDVISTLYQFAEDVEQNKKKKSYGVIGGSVTSIAGGVLSITGAALIPISFGASAGLIASGIGISVAGSGTSIGFSIDKMLKDKKIKNDVQKRLEIFIKFQDDFVRALGNIFMLKDGIDKIQILVPFKKRQNSIKRDETIDNIQRMIIQLHLGNVSDAYNIAEIMSQTRLQSEELLKAFGKIEEEFHMKVIDRDNSPLETLISYTDAINGCGLFKESRSFLNFALDYLQFEQLNNTDIFLSTSGAKTLTGTTVTSKAALAGADVAGSIAQYSGHALKIAKGFATAGIVLGALGLVTDFAFIGKAIYDLVEKDPFSEGLVNLCNLMEKINDWQGLSKD